MAKRHPSPHISRLHPSECMKIRTSAEITIDGARKHEDANGGISKCCGNRLSRFLDHLSTESVDWCTAEFEPSNATINAETHKFETMRYSIDVPRSTERIR